MVLKSNRYLLYLLLFVEGKSGGGHGGTQFPRRTMNEMRPLQLFLRRVRLNAQIITKYLSLINMVQSFLEIKSCVMYIFILYNF